MSHSADTIIDALVIRLTGLSTTGNRVFLAPFLALEASDLPALSIENIDDEVIDKQPGSPRIEKHRLSFQVFCCAMASTASVRGVSAQIREEVEVALLGSQQAVTLGGLVRKGLERTRAVLDFDVERLQKPVGGWRLYFECTYHLRTDAPGVIA